MYTGSTSLAVIGSPALVMRRPLSSLHRRSLPDPTTIVLGEGGTSCANAGDIDAVKNENEKKTIPVMRDFIVHLNVVFGQNAISAGTERSRLTPLS
jgi:hypothetical protein